MANVSCDTGNSATVTFSTSTLSYNFTGIDLGSEAVGKIEKSHLLTTGFKAYMPEDLDEPGEIVLDYQFDNSSTQPALGTVETITVTAPTANRASDGQAQATPATWVGTGFITDIKRPSMQNNTLQVGQLTFAFDGGTGPTFTAGTYA